MVSNDLNLSADGFKTIYKKRCSVEEYHKSLKQNVGIGQSQSPTRTVQTPSAHLFASILAYLKLEGLKLSGKNHFAFKAKIYFAANKAAFQEVQKLHLDVPKVKTLFQSIKKWYQLKAQSLHIRPEQFKTRILNLKNK